ncbi:LuxR C-terminal-related transcriptional regulator [Labrys sp. KB_33_2]|uniref:LuxR C-terminal-related transcriptional regulator n=1 Tax=Labrys sp. KB_33_2 TaxID=3237479 RepID=UPI003F92FBA6
MTADRRLPIHQVPDTHYYDRTYRQRRRNGRNLTLGIHHVTLVSDNLFLRDSFAYCLRGSSRNFLISSHETVQAWLNVDPIAAPGVVLFFAVGQRQTDLAVSHDIHTSRTAVPNARIVIISDVEESSLVVKAIENGAHGYIPMSIDMNIIIEAIRLVEAGGTYVPSTLLTSACREVCRPATEPEHNRSNTLLTPRQIEVLELLRKGNSNKAIAYKLNMSECTVKVHVRNMMKRYRVRNRTQLACTASGYF